MTMIDAMHGKTEKEQNQLQQPWSDRTQEDPNKAIVEESTNNNDGSVDYNNTNWKSSLNRRDARGRSTNSSEQPLDPQSTSRATSCERRTMTEERNDSFSSGKKQKVGGGTTSNGFKSFGLSESVYKGIVRLGFRIPTPVQRKALPVALSGVDTVVMARTGSGKTCAFLIPLLEKLVNSPKGEHGNHVRGLILSPTRELSMQTLKVFHKLATDTDVKAIGIHGGEGMEKQFNLLASKPDVIVATPGRLAHHLAEIPDFTLSGCMVCILDECDRVIELGFSAQLRQIAKTLPESCQKLLFSATMPKVLLEFTKSGFAVDPAVVRLDHEASVSEELRISFITCRSSDKDATLLHVLGQILCDSEDATAKGRTGLTLIFAATRHHVEYLATLLALSGIDATMIYGSMDQEARKLNLASFRSGKKPVLVVTDVAARGIDVPLIDHVIHYHFPPSPKLFIHRSGRCARAGRIGFCWGLVEPDEVAYMIDLHLCLGRQPSTGIDRTSSQDSVGLTYSLDEMTPDMVHYGAVPESVLTAEVENVHRILNSELSGSQEAESLRSLTIVCNNAMKQYRRTRIEASREGIRRAKAILEGERLESGERIGKGSVPPHPLFRRAERRRQEGRKGLGTVENAVKREDFLLAMSNFRPKETVFEAFATGGGKEVGIVSQVDKGRTVAMGKKHDSSAALVAMKDMRRQMRMARDKGSALVVAGSETSHAATEEAEDGKSPARDQDRVQSLLSQESVQIPSSRKRHLSRAERRKQKKDPTLSTSSQGPASSAIRSTKPKCGSDFRDAAYFIDSESASNTEEVQRSRRLEAAMQPSAASTSRGSQGMALRLEEAMLDIVGDEKEELVQKQRMMRWDKSKRKYVQTTVGAELSGDSKTKKLRLENGALVKNEKLKLGELYEKWQKKTNRSVGRSGVFDDSEGPVPPGGAEPRKQNQRKKGDGGTRELKSALAIKKERAKKQNLKIKNMKKGDRRAMEQKEKEKRSAFRKRDRR